MLMIAHFIAQKISISPFSFLFLFLPFHTERRKKKRKKKGNNIYYWY